MFLKIFLTERNIGVFTQITANSQKMVGSNYAQFKCTGDFPFSISNNNYSLKIHRDLQLLFVITIYNFN
jgi:hypothetical protein